MVLNKKKQIVVTNHSLSTLSGFSDFDIVGKTYKEVFEFFSDDEGNEECRFIDDVFSIHKQKATTNKATLKSKSGDLIPVFSTASPLFNNDGLLTGAVVVVRDIRKEREVDKMKTEFVSVASHQLKTPLTGAMWTLELLENEETGPLNEQQKQLIKELAETHKGMSDLVSEMLNVSRIDRGEKFDILKTREEINSIIKSSIIELRKLSEMNNIEVTFATSDEEINIDIDAKKIEEAVKNLISNAIKYSPKNSKVNVNVRKEIGNKKVVIEIIDYGIGIPENEKEHIFEKFYRASNAKSNDISGTGLGLYIAKAVAEGHGGDLRFESKEGEGTKFIMEIPLS